jgi:hypothetical protein
MNGEVDVSGRALIVLSIRPSHGAEAVSLQAWVDTAFTGELVIPRATITRLGLPLIMVGCCKWGQCSSPGKWKHVDERRSSRDRMAPAMSTAVD